MNIHLLLSSVSINVLYNLKRSLFRRKLHRRCGLECKHFFERKREKLVGKERTYLMGLVKNSEFLPFCLILGFGRCKRYLGWTFSLFQIQIFLAVFFTIFMTLNFIDSLYI